jgi:LAO/AO transport system kinase
MSLPKNAPLDIKALTKDLRAGHRAALARAITLIESRRGDHQAVARELVQTLLRDTGKAVRVGITGSPGVGKSTTIDALGMFLIERGHQVAVLAVDPSSARTGGSILADKTRMARLAASDSAYIRREYRSALHILAPRSKHWDPPVVTYSALTGSGIGTLWQKILDQRTAMKASG